MQRGHGVMSDQETRELICELCRDFYRLGWASGTGGGISIKRSGQIYMASSGVQKERLSVDDIFVLDEEGVIMQPARAGLELSECHPLFMNAYQIRGAGAVLHSHSINAVLVTLLYEDAFKVTNLEMMKGIDGVGVFDTHEVPIIPNAAREGELSGAMAAAMRDYPKAQAVLVKGHGVYVWGKDWVQAKTQAECYDYLFQAAVMMKRLGLDPSSGGQS